MPLGLVSITLVILQPVAVGTWCSLCLLTAAAMLAMIPLTLDEVVAMIQFMVRSVRDGKPFWSTFWQGGTVENGGPDHRSPGYEAPIAQLAPAMVWGVTLPWSLIASTAIGLWLMGAPAVFGTQGATADSHHLVGAAVASIAVIAMAEVVRATRFLNVPLGIWIIVAPWLLGGASGAAIAGAMVCGAALVVLSLPRGPIRERYGGWDPYVR